MQDPQQAQVAAQHMIAAMAPLFMLFGLLGILVWLLGAFLFWRCFTKAGMAGALGLIALIPGVGWFVCACILAFAHWNVVPIPAQYGAFPPPGYPPHFPARPPAYPPAGYTPQGPVA